MKIILPILCLLLAACVSETEDKEMRERINIFNHLGKLVDENFYDPDFNGIDWGQKQEEYLPKIRECTNSDEFFDTMNEMLFELNSSHCGVGLISDRDDALSPYVFGQGSPGFDIRITDNQIVITEVRKNSSADSNRLKTGMIIEKIDGVSLAEIEKEVIYRPPYNERNKKYHLTREVVKRIFGDPFTELTVEVRIFSGKLRAVTLFRDLRTGKISLSLVPLACLEVGSHYINNDIAYLRFNVFLHNQFEDILKEYEKIKHSKKLIIDLRGNDGGSIDKMKTLLGKFVRERILYGTYINRHERNPDYIEPDEETYRGEVVVLVDEMSISAAENMAGIFQRLNLGTVIGTQTPGQLLWGNGYSINDSIICVLPIYKLEYVDGYNPENNGVVPDIVVDLSIAALSSGIDSQLARAVRYLKTGN
jgi:C-terminal processing protease CtpA/Prc